MDALEKAMQALENYEKEMTTYKPDADALARYHLLADTYIDLAMQDTMAQLARLKVAQAGFVIKTHTKKGKPDGHA